MSAPGKTLSALAPKLPVLASSSCNPLPPSQSRTFLFLRFFVAPRRTLPRGLGHIRPCATVRHYAMPRRQGRGNHGQKKWKEKGSLTTSPGRDDPLTAEALISRLGGLNIVESNGQAHVAVPASQVCGIKSVDNADFKGHKAIWKPRAYATVSGASSVAAENKMAGEAAVEIQENGSDASAAQDISSGLSNLFKNNYLGAFTVDKSTYTRAEIRATFYPKFENEKSDQEIRTRMIEMVSKGLASVEVSLKHSGSLFMYAGNEGGAYAKNSFGNVYTAVGVFVLARMFREAWGVQAENKQAEFNDFLEENRMCISMELVTAVLGDHGQRPKEDYVVVTAVTELGNGKPKFYSTPEVIAFCRKWRLPTNHTWLFSTRKSVTSFFAAYDALCEEGTATPVCKALDEVADISVPGSKDHVKVQGEILEGLVARIVSHESSKHLEAVLRDFPPPPDEGDYRDLGPSLREICAANRSDTKQQIKVLLKSVGTSFCRDYSDWLGDETGARNADKSVVSKFLQSRPADYSTTKLQEMIRLMKEKGRFATFKCYHNFHKINSISSDNLFYKMVIHVHNDSAFRRYQREMRFNPGLWPLYRGFFVDINLFKTNKEHSAEIAKGSQDFLESTNGSTGASSKDSLADDDVNLMIKLKFLTYKLRTFLIRNGLSVLFKNGPASYKAYYERQMKIWGTSPGKQRQLSKMLDEWAVYIRRKCGKNQLSSATYLSEAEPFLEQYAKRSVENQALIGSAGSFVKAEDFLAIIEGGRDEEGDLETEKEVMPSSPSALARDSITKDRGLIVFFPGIPGCAKSALCKELLSAPGVLGDDRQVHYLMGDLIKGRYWQKVSDECRKSPYSVILADKNAPNEEVWRQIEDMCRSTKAAAVPVVADSEGTDSNPFSLDALAVFMFRVLQRVNHPGNLDKASPNAGYVLLMFYHLYEGKSRQEFESELIERFGSIVKMPLLKADRGPLPDPVNLVLAEGINLYNLHRNKHGRLESNKGTYAKEWSKWEKQLRETLFSNAEYLNSIQDPFDSAVKQVSEQLKNIASGEYTTPATERRKLGTIVFAAVSLPVSHVHDLLNSLAEKHPDVATFLGDKHMESDLKKAHVTLAHKRSHGVTAIASYGPFVDHDVPVEFTALLFNKKMAAFEVHLGSVDGEALTSKNEWPHATIWTAAGVTPKEANTLPSLLSEGKATRVEINPPVTMSGPLQFF